VILIPAEKLRQITEVILMAGGAPQTQAHVVADSLVLANLLGYDTHGVLRLPQYVRMLGQGKIRPDAAPRTVVDLPALAVVDGDWGFGQVIGRMAADLAIEKARATGIAAVSVRAANHLGRIGEYPERIAQAGLVGLAFCNSTGELVAPFGGSRPRLSVGVLAAAAPWQASAEADGAPFLLDMACSVIPEGKARLLRNRELPLPEGSALDADGNPTTDPAAFYGPPLGALLPLGGPAGHKGYGIGLLCELLAGALGGSGCSGNPDVPWANGLLLIALSPEAFGTAEASAQQAESLFARIKACPPAPGAAEVLVPGEPEGRTSQRRREGIPVDEETFRQIVATAEETGCVLDLSGIRSV
jgi:uncharacterized oxidoreductase